MHNVRIGRLEDTYFIGIKPPLPRDMFDEFEAHHPYGTMGTITADTAGWPLAAVVSRHQAPELILGVRADQLNIKTYDDGWMSQEEFLKLADQTMFGYLRDLALKRSDVSVDLTPHDVELTEAGEVTFAS
jgi:hypothetical protein